MSEIQMLAQQFIAVERAPFDKLYSAKQAQLDAQLKAIKGLSTQYKEFSKSLEKLEKVESFGVNKASLNDETFASVSASDKAAPGEYNIYVKKLAQSHQVSMSFSGEDWLAPTQGQLTLGVGSGADLQEMTLDLSALPAGATLAELRDAINQATDNPGVKASLVRTGSDVKLMLTSEQSGAANTISMSVSGGAGDPQMTELSAAMAAKTELTQAQDAEIQMGTTSPLTLTSSSNNFDNVIDGISLTVNKVHDTDDGGLFVGSPLVVKVERDSEAIKENIQGFVDSYNTLIDKLNEAYKGGLKTDSSVRSMLGQLRSELNQPSSTGLRLSEIGITTDRSGKLTISDSKLKEALTQEGPAVAALFSESTGLIARMDQRVEPFIETDGIFAKRTQNINRGLEQVTASRDRLDMRMDAQMNRYIKQFSQMEAAMRQMQSTSSLFLF